MAQGQFHRFPSRLIGRVQYHRQNTHLVTVLCSAQALARGHRRQQLLALTNPQIMCTLSAALPVSLTMPFRAPELRN